MKSKNLFTGKIEELPERQRHSLYLDFKRRNNYRKAQLSDNSKQCGNCINFQRWRHEHGKIYFKCKMMGVSNSEATDIRKSYICDLYQGKNDI